MRIQELLIVLLIGVAVSCTPYEDRIFDFSLSDVGFPEETESLTLSLFSEIELPTSEFRIFDSILVARDACESFGLTAFSLNSGDTLLNLCRTGRGDGETLLLAPIEIVDGVAHVADAMTTKYLEVNIPESIKQGRTVIERQSQFGNSGFSAYYSIHSVGKDTLICNNGQQSLDTRSLTGSPGLSIFNLSDGSCIAEYQVANSKYAKLWKKNKKIAQTSLLRFSDCLVPGRDEMCLAFHYFPVVAFFDYREGVFRGIRITGIPEYRSNKDTFYFGKVYSDGECIYLLYHGDSCSRLYDESLLENVRTNILKMNLEGEEIKCYQLDGPYSDFEICGRTMYLSKSTDIDHLYTLSLDSI